MTAARRCRWLRQGLPEVTALAAGGAVGRNGTCRWRRHRDRRWRWTTGEAAVAATHDGGGRRTRQRQRPLDAATMTANGGSGGRRWQNPQPLGTAVAAGGTGNRWKRWKEKSAAAAWRRGAGRGFHAIMAAEKPLSYSSPAMILDTNPQLYFHLQQQRLIELIRSGKIEEALEFAQEELAPRGEENQSFLEELEKTVSLLVFEDAKNCPYGDLLDVSQRLKTASELNAAILTSQSHEKDPKLPSMLKMLIWAQNQLDEKAVYPKINNLTAAALEDPEI
ncbi:hypothetical protein ZIOFF_016994 [Zingiber officinale]|uniref:CTLH domain-containing protein n=1 Tax=Zingiber officinale TaxID=94328 RepID=A0A8J5H483_ZINOF|nr:hypothetical protein ZIOFF_016994 [Zingiber officinale]